MTRDQELLTKARNEEDQRNHFRRRLRGRVRGASTRQDTRSDSLDKTLEDPALLIGMYSVIGRMRLTAADKVVLAAEEIADTIVESYSRPPTTFGDIYKIVREGRVDPLKAFTEACRDERMGTLKHL
jgi:hypothetical protein